MPGKISVEVEGVQLQAEHLTESLAESVLRTRLPFSGVWRLWGQLYGSALFGGFLRLLGFHCFNPELNCRVPQRARKNMQDTKLQAIELRMSQLRVAWKRLVAARVS